ncbi:tetraprenyl-beta-curcumene synthase [Oikeobacillus pervagus]|uniref:Tetraprenyl-beta-curcumene synthase n=1 Tax=Oikeobacillus pervagus TaxID=1325931 RepID=A0AAJ1T4K6_9BACI|nr:tetraprenyl-beta-curcumene synthase family protein [Oikeobacillus pervagus]MDQ0215769.1 tetraprenyl-beta-curcumene synthase [Oikeobacillus pervagus]
MKLPNEPLTLMRRVYKDVFPVVHKELDGLKQKAMEIPNRELRRQALSSIQLKTFHCEGGAILALISLEKMEDAIKFIVAYQTISDYLDNLCDRSNSLDPKDFAALHEAAEDALTVGAPIRNYYRYRMDQDDGGYLYELVHTCQSVLGKIKHLDKITPFLQELCHYYCDLQVHKHVQIEEREDRLIQWFHYEEPCERDLYWYEFSACAGSTLGIFCLIAYSLRDDFQLEVAKTIRDGYFPFVQGLHILLDYFIDQEEDHLEGDLNFCFYYENNEMIFRRFQYFFEQADLHARLLPDAKFHQLIIRGLLGVYLSDEKVRREKKMNKMAKKMVRFGGTMSMFFYYNARAYRFLAK